MANGGATRRAPDHVPWNLRDAAAGVFSLLLLTVALSLAFAGLVQFADRGLDAEAALLVLAAVGAYVGAAAVARLLGAPVGTLTRVVVVATLVVGLAVFSSSGTGDDRVLFGAPVELVVEMAVVLVDVAVAATYSVQKYGAPWSSLGFVPSVGRNRTLGALGIWLLSLALIGGIDALMNWLGIDVLTPPQNAADTLDAFGGHLLPALIAVGIFVPVAEETFFRGFVLSALRNRFGATIAVVLSAMLFALFHVYPGLYLPIFILGLALGTARVWTGSLWPSIMIHMAQNLLALALAYQQIDLP